ncbi:MAG: hypothetical protein ACLR7D_11200 [Lachnospira eligens]
MKSGISMVHTWLLKVSQAQTEDVFGKMAHSERRGDSVAINIYGEQDIKIFESGVKYFK